MSAYADLLARLSAEQPRYGWSYPDMLPTLTYADLAAVIEDDSAVLLEALDTSGSIGDATRTLRLTLTCHDMERRIGGLLLSRLDALARVHLHRALKAEAERHYWEGVDRGRERAKDRAIDEAGLSPLGEP